MVSRAPHEELLTQGREPNESRLRERGEGWGGNELPGCWAISKVINVLPGHRQGSKK